MGGFCGYFPLGMLDFYSFFLKRESLYKKKKNNKERQNESLKKNKKNLGLCLPLSGLLPTGGEGGLHAYSPLG